MSNNLSKKRTRSIKHATPTKQLTGHKSQQQKNLTTFLSKVKSNCTEKIDIQSSPALTEKCLRCTHNVV